VTTLFLLTLLCPLLAFSQQKKDNLFVITPSDTTGLYDQVIKVFTEQGYKLLHTDRKDGVIVTKYTVLGKYRTMMYSLSVLLRKNRVYLSGVYQPDRIVYKIAYGEYHIPKQLWEEMDRIAKLFGSVSYARRENGDPLPE